MVVHGETYIFVYGTLRKGVRHPMRRVLVQHATYAGMGTFQGKLYNLARYPAAVASTGESDRVAGELYKLRRHTRALKILDDYEGRAFKREQSPVFLETGRKITAWVYLYTGSVTESTLIHTGDYLAFLSKR